MEPIRRLRNEVREYAWGSRTAIADLLGEPSPSERPQAELWMGAHPGAPSRVSVGSEWVPLGDWLRGNGAGRLGAGVVEAFGAELPFLLKVLAVERPLSLQAHPNAEQAGAGFAREDRAGVARDAPHRNYRDPHPKPELICALTPFTAMCGFRKIDDLMAQVDELRANRLAALAAPLRFDRTPARLRAFYDSLVGLDPEAASAVVREAVEAAESGHGDPAVRGWLRKLALAYPGDPGVLAPLFLNVIELLPGEALFLPAGQLHSYLHGTAVEIMSNSDNVLRGGLTQKHVAVDELLATLDFEPRLPDVLDARAVAPGEAVYDTPAREFELAALSPAAGRPVASGPRDRVEILFCAAGEVVLDGESGLAVERGAAKLGRGSAVLVPAAAGAYRLTGEAVVYRATVPRDSVRTGSR